MSADVDLSDEPQAILDRLAILYAAKAEAAEKLASAKEDVKLWRETLADAARDLDRYHAGLSRPTPLFDREGRRDDRHGARLA